MKEIQRLRKKHGMSQAALAKMLGVTSSTVAKWESSEAYPRTQLLPKLAKIFNCSIDDLFRGIS